MQVLALQWENSQFLQHTDAGACTAVGEQPESTYIPELFIKYRLNGIFREHFFRRFSRLLSKNVKVRIYKTIILPVVLYGCETWSLTLRQEHKLRVFENMG
jgi:hypothetical protein